MSKLIEALNELDGYKNSNKFPLNGEIKVISDIEQATNGEN